MIYVYLLIVFAVLTRPVTFRVKRRRRQIYSGHVRLCVCLYVCLFLAVFPHYCTDPGVSRGNGRGCPLVVHYWANLQSVHGYRCYDNIAPNAKCQRVLVLDLCLLLFAFELVEYVLCTFLLFLSVVHHEFSCQYHQKRIPIL